MSWFPDLKIVDPVSESGIVEMNNASIARFEAAKAKIEGNPDLLAYYNYWVSKGQGVNMVQSWCGLRVHKADINSYAAMILEGCIASCIGAGMKTDIRSANTLSYPDERAAAIAALRYAGKPTTVSPPERTPEQLEFERIVQVERDREKLTKKPSEEELRQESIREEARRKFEVEQELNRLRREENLRLQALRAKVRR